MQMRNLFRYDMATLMDEIIQSAKVEVASDPQNDLSLGWRRKIAALLGPKADNGIGHQRRFGLSVLMLRHVLPYWTKALPHDHTPAEGYDFAWRLFSGKIHDDNAASSERDRIWTHCDELVYARKDVQIIAGVGYASAQLVALANHDEISKRTA
jgi:hypothetical protein